MGGVCVGNLAGENYPFNQSVAIGNNAGNNEHGFNSISIGHDAGVANGYFANAIVLNATGSTLNPTAASRCLVKPVRAVATPVPAGFYPVFYDATTKELVCHSS